MVSPAGAVKALHVALPEEIRSLDTLADPDYTDACEITISNSDTRSPDQWARAIFEDAPRALRWFVVSGWIAGLGLRLGPRPSPAHVLGWKILTATPSVIVLGVHSIVLSNHLVLRVQDSSIVLATFVRYERRPAPIVWGVAQPIHRRVVPYLLRRAATHPPGG